MEYQQLIDSLTPDVVARLRRGVETGRWPDGRPLTPEQREHSLQAIIAWDERHAPTEQRVGFIDQGHKGRKGRKGRKDGGSEQDPGRDTLRWVTDGEDKT